MAPRVTAVTTNYDSGQKWRDERRRWMISNNLAGDLLQVGDGDGGIAALANDRSSLSGKVHPKACGPRHGRGH